MKKTLALVLAILMIVAAFAGCTKTPDPVVSGEVVDNGPTYPQINVYSFTNEVPNMLPIFARTFGYPEDMFNITIIATTDGAYQPALDEALASGNVDIFCAEAAFIKKYTAKAETATYADFGIQMAETVDSGIAPYTIDVGSNDNGDLMGLGYQATGGAFIYRASIAEEAFGTSDPDAIGELLNDWDKFFAAAETLNKDFNVAMVSGEGDLWHPMENSREGKWVDADNNLVLDENVLQFFDFAKKLKDDNLYNGTQDWQEAWFADMKGEGERPCFGFFGPAWLINYVMKGNCGGEKPGEGTYGDWRVCVPTIGFYWGGTWVLGSKAAAAGAAQKEIVGEIIRWITLDTSVDGLQYRWANGDTVASSVIMDKFTGKWDFLGGQSAFSIFVPANEKADGHTLSMYDEDINSLLREQVRLYRDGEKDKDTAIADFAAAVKDRFPDINID